jgi:hypothetical protein
MKKLLILVALLSATAIAGERYIIIAARDDLTNADKLKIRDKIKELPRHDWHNIERMTDMPQYRSIANTNITWRIICLDRAKHSSPWPKIPWTKEQYEAWKDNNLAAPNKVQVRKSEDPQAELTAAGLEPMPSVKP